MHGKLPVGTGNSDPENSKPCLTYEVLVGYTCERGTGRDRIVGIAVEQEGGNRN